VLARHRRVAGSARVRLGGSEGAAFGLVQVNLRVAGVPARIQSTGRTMDAAISSAAARLVRQITRLTTAWEDWPWPDPQRRLLAVPGEATISRLKSFRLHVTTPCQAAAILHAMDYSVYLYTDADTGEDAVVHRCGPTGLCLARQRTNRPPLLPSILPLTVNPRRAPVLTPGQAASRMSDGWLPFVFYTDHRSRRGNLLYRRYDGRLGLITPTTLAREIPPPRRVI
jgi:hypothetical protein